jgi:hypothetical protein
MRLVATTIPCVIDLLSTHTHADVVATSGVAIPWLQVALLLLLLLPQKWS